MAIVSRMKWSKHKASSLKYHAANGDSGAMRELAKRIIAGRKKLVKK